MATDEAILEDSAGYSDDVGSGDDYVEYDDGFWNTDFDIFDVGSYFGGEDTSTYDDVDSGYSYNGLLYDEFEEDDSTYMDSINEGLVGGDKESSLADMLLGETSKDKVDTILGSLGGLLKTGFGEWQRQQSQERADDRDTLAYQRTLERDKLLASLKKSGGGKADPVTARAEGEGEEQKGDFTKRIV